MFKYIYLGKEIPPLPTFNLLLGIGMIAFFLSLERVFRRNAISFQLADEIKKIAFYAATFGVLGAVVGESIFQRNGIDLRFSGFTFYGGFFGAISSLWLISLVKNLNFFYLSNIMIAPLVIGHAFGRIGCFLGGCCFGRPTKSIFGVIYPSGSLPNEQFGSQALYPIQLIESVFLFILFIILTRIKLNWKFATYLVIYPILRFLIEFYRGDNRGMLTIDIISPSQEISLVLLLSGIMIFYKKLTFDNIKPYIQKPLQAKDMKIKNSYKRLTK